MNATLKVKNFGPIKDVELDLRDVNVFIGPQASGKSVLAKLYTICKSPIMYHQTRLRANPFSKSNNNMGGALASYIVDVQKFKVAAEKYSLNSFFSDDTFIYFKNSIFTFEYFNGSISFVAFEGLLKYVDSNFDLITIDDEQLNRDWECLMELSNFISTYHSMNKNNEVNLNNGWKISLINFALINEFENTVNYIPSERTLAVLLKKAALNLMHQRVPIPEHLLEFAANYNTASDKIKNLDLSYLKSSASYKNIDGEDFILDDGTTLKLSESASGLQSVVPLLITLEHLRNDKEENAFHQAFVIEEPETNLFPKAQYALLKYLERNRPDDDGKIDTGSVHIYTTHSPFILSSLNNMLYAYKKGNAASPSVQEEIAKVLPKENWISPERFNAYQIIDGKAESIFDRESGLIQENIIDQISDDIIEDFRSIAIATMES